MSSVPARRPQRRPVKLSAKLAKRIADQVRAGNYIGVAARNVGIDPTAAYHWLSEAQEEGARPLVRSFAAQIAEAEAQAESHAVLIVRKSMADGDWRAAMEYLKRRHPERWGDQLELRHSGAITLSHKASQKELDAFAGEKAIDVEAEEVEDGPAVP